MTGGPVPRWPIERPLEYRITGRAWTLAESRPALLSRAAERIQRWADLRGWPTWSLEWRVELDTFVEGDYLIVVDSAFRPGRTRALRLPCARHPRRDAAFLGVEWIGGPIRDWPLCTECCVTLGITGRPMPSVAITRAELEEVSERRRVRIAKAELRAEFDEALKDGLVLPGVYEDHLGHAGTCPASRVPHGLCTCGRSWFDNPSPPAEPPPT